MKNFSVLPGEKNLLLLRWQHQLPLMHFSNHLSSLPLRISLNASPLFAASAIRQGQADSLLRKCAALHSQSALTCNMTMRWPMTAIINCYRAKNKNRYETDSRKWLLSRTRYSFIYCAREEASRYSLINEDCRRNYMWKTNLHISEIFTVLYIETTYNVTTGFFFNEYHMVFSARNNANWSPSPKMTINIGCTWEQGR